MRSECIAPRAAGERIYCPNARAPGSLFCRAHEQAPAAQRGGWLSAERRRRKLAGSADHVLDASRITDRVDLKLWVGSRPPVDRDLPEFDVVALCAREFQPQMAFHGRVLRCPIPDGPLEQGEVRVVILTARAVAASLSRGRRVLVTCSAGLNRSGLVASLALAVVTRMSADELIATMRKYRHPNALYNVAFQGLIHKFVGAGRSPLPPTRR